MTEAPAALSSDVNGLEMRDRTVLPGFDEDSHLPGIHGAFPAIAKKKQCEFPWLMCRL